jgi:hypothetical protein
MSTLQEHRVEENARVSHPSEVPYDSSYDRVSSITGDVMMDLAGKKAKRLCRFPGCNRVIKSQGHCQRHGAKPKRCRVEGCQKQAQGTHDGMCKRHWKALHFPDPRNEMEKIPPAPEGESVYDSILPASIAYRPHLTSGARSLSQGDNEGDEEHDFEESRTASLHPHAAAEASWNTGGSSETGHVMPLINYLHDNAHKESGWHRNTERRARGMFPVTGLSAQLEPWERQLLGSPDFIRVPSNIFCWLRFRLWWKYSC